MAKKLYKLFHKNDSIAQIIFYNDEDSLVISIKSFDESGKEIDLNIIEAAMLEKNILTLNHALNFFGQVEKINKVQNPILTPIDRDDFLDTLAETYTTSNNSTPYGIFSSNSYQNGAIGNAISNNQHMQNQSNTQQSNFRRIILGEN